MRALILAGGFATRLWPLTERRAKPLLPLAGEPILSRVLAKVPEGIPVTVSTNAAFGEDVRRWAATRKRQGLTVAVEHTTREEEKLGALGAVAQWIRDERAAEDLLLLTGDNEFGFRLEDFLAAATPGVPLLAAHDIGDRERASAFGTVILAQDGRSIAAFEEKPKEPKSTLVSTGCSLLPAAALPILTEYATRHPDNVGGIFEELLRRGMRVECFRFEEPWFDIGSFPAYLEATRAIVGRRALTAPDAAVDAASRLEGSVVVGAGCAVHGSVLRDTVLFPGCIVEDCILDSCVLDEGCRLRGIDLTGKMLRAGTVLRQE